MSIPVGPDDIDFDSDGNVVIRNAELAGLLRERAESESAQSVTVDLYCSTSDNEDRPPLTGCGLSGGNTLCSCTYPMGGRICR
ncbi:hypothetical protein [Jatrophihabitans sp.]|uniref:hypothetical protein n=1 Tax=Jatrophihabitans sp. TaxID=1932789 RepID=UPI002C2C4BE9|nr:hypothetical protein [Jatrophihabitans sp.]